MVLPGLKPEVGCSHDERSRGELGPGHDFAPGVGEDCFFGGEHNVSRMFSCLG